MCGRYVTVTKLERIRKEFNHPLLDTEIELDPNYFVVPGENVPVISSENSSLIVGMRFGYTPSWGTKSHFVINARSEGDSNKSNDPMFNGGKGIISKPFFRSTIRQRRCLVIADAFIEGTKEKKLKEPFLVFPREKKRPFTLAGVWDDWINQDTGEIVKGFAIVTTKPNDIMIRIGHHRSPVVIPEGDRRKWLNPDTPLNEVTSMLEPFDSNKWNAFKIDPELMKEKTLEGLQPISELVYDEFKIVKTFELKEQGFGSRKDKK